MGYQKEDPSVSIIIPTYNGKHWLRECLSSLYDLKYPAKRMDIKLVDNNSTDGTVQFVRRYFRKVEVLRNPGNNYCQANNLGIARSRSQLLAFLNNDTQVDRYWLRALVDAILKDERIGCVCSKVVFPDGRIQSTGHYEFPNFRWGDRGLREPDIGQYSVPEEVVSLSGSSVLFRRSCLDDVGHFDEDFIMYLEDVDISLRCRQKAWKLVYVPGSIVRHAFHGTADERQVRYYIERNRLLLIAKHFPKELPRALETKEHSLTHEELYRMLPDLFLKLFTIHKEATLKPVLNDFFWSLQRVHNFSKDQIVQELNTILRNTRQEVETVIHEKAAFGEVMAKLECEVRARSAQMDTLRQEVQKTKADAEFEKSGLGAKIDQLEAAISGLREDAGRKSRIIAEQERLLAERSALLQKTDELRVILEQGLSQKNAALAKTQALFFELEASAAGLQAEMANRAAALKDLLRQRDELQQQLAVRSEELRALAISRQEELHKLNVECVRLKQDAENLSGQISDIFHSRTYRYLAIPFWRIADFVKKFIFSRKRQKRILVIKPYYVSLEAAESALIDLRNKYMGARITLFANVFKQDYGRLSASALAEEKKLYSPSLKKLTLLRLLGVAFWLNARYFDETILLIGPAVYHGYRKSKLLAFAVGGRSIRLYYCGAKTLAPFVSFGLWQKARVVLAFIWGIAALWLVLVGFVGFVVIPLKLKKAFRR